MSMTLLCHYVTTSLSILIDVVGVGVMVVVEMVVVAATVAGGTMDFCNHVQSNLVLANLKGLIIFFSRVSFSQE